MPVIEEYAGEGQAVDIQIYSTWYTGWTIIKVKDKVIENIHDMNDYGRYYIIARMSDTYQFMTWSKEILRPDEIKKLSPPV